MITANKMLSKTQFTYYIQCPKYLWLYKNKKDLYKGEEDLSYKQLQGESVEFWVYRQHKDGVDCEAEGGDIASMEYPVAAIGR